MISFSLSRATCMNTAAHAKLNAAEQVFAAGHWSGRDFLLRVQGIEVEIDGIAVGGQSLGPPGCFPGPVILGTGGDCLVFGHRCSLGNPGPDDGDLLLRERFRLGGHSQFGVLRGDPLQQQALGRLLGDHRRSRFTSLVDQSCRVESQLGFPAPCSVTGDAVFDQDRPHVALEFDTGAVDRRR